MRRFFSHFKTLAGVLILLMLPFAILKLQKKAPLLTEAVAGTFLDMASYFQRSVIWTFGGLSDAMERRLISQTSTGELFQLRVDRVQMRSLEILLSESERENRRLKDLLDFASQDRAPKVLGTRVIGQAGAPLMQVIQIDQGSHSGIKKGDPVINRLGAIGQVLLAAKTSSEVLLMSDASSAVDIVVQRTRVRGIMRGLKVHNFDRLQDIQVGDVIVTSGLGARFPEGTPVGQIVRLRNHQQGLYTEAEIEPFVDLNRLEEVLVLRDSRLGSAWHRRDLVFEGLQMSVGP